MEEGLTSFFARRGERRAMEQRGEINGPNGLRRLCTLRGAGRRGEGREGKGGYSIVDYLAEEGKIGYRGRVLYAIIYNVNRLGKGYSKFPITSCIAAVEPSPNGTVARAKWRATETETNMKLIKHIPSNLKSLEGLSTAKADIGFQSHLVK